MIRTPAASCVDSTGSLTRKSANLLGCSEACGAHITDAADTAVATGVKPGGRVLATDARRTPTRTPTLHFDGSALLPLSQNGSARQPDPWKRAVRDSEYSTP